MLQRMGYLTAIITLALGGAGTAAAAPDTDGARCDFTLTGPTVVEVSGVPMVSVAVLPAACTGTAKPTSSQVCVSAPGTLGRCNELPGNADPHVYLSPYIPGTTYTAKGRGCSAVMSPPQTVCTTLGPASATL